MSSTSTSAGRPRRRIASVLAASTAVALVAGGGLAGINPAAALPRDPAPMVTPTGAPVTVDDGYLTSTDGKGTRLAYRVNKLPKAKGAVVVIHGAAEHLGRYEYVTAHLNAAGYDVYRINHRGHGTSAEPFTSFTRGHIDDFHSLVDDVHQLVERARAEHSDTPVYLLGHSMGALASQFYGIKYPGTVDGIVTNGGGIPFSLDGPNTERAQRLTPEMVGNAIELQFPTLSETLPLSQVTALDSAAGELVRQAVVDPKGIRLPAEPWMSTVQMPNKMLFGITSDPEVKADYDRDELINPGLSLGMIEQMAGVASVYNAVNAPTFTAPTLIMHGVKDGIVPAYFDVNWFNAIGSTDKKFIEWENMEHEVFNEPGKDQALDTVVSWLDERTTR